MKVNVLGTNYDLIESDKSKYESLAEMDGFCDTSVKLCVVDKMEGNAPDMKRNLSEYKKSVKRHELIHAFLFESGMSSCSWGPNEEMVDWIAIQFPKMLKAFEGADCL